MTDEALVARAQGGDEEAWAELVRRHHAAVFRAAHAALVSRADADDAAQEAWIAAWHALGEFRGHASFRTWVLTIAWRKSLDRRRSLASWLRMRRLDAEDDHPLAVTLASTDASIVERLEDSAARARMKTLIRALPRGYRDALVLMATGDFSYVDGAALLRIPVGTLKWRVSEARRLLRARIGARAQGDAHDA